ncbi:hypothetical protein Hamer_G014858 [Homarus americanus]|uniref:Uncharacterized protein n=1 Tax=Homarus americanus TaxID=6706 RepID=A0A8J5JRS1_HOMAM|nr:hypothetical protein Hamer_G014858 [Homarus americanus]
MAEAVNRLEVKDTILSKGPDTMSPDYSTSAPWESPPSVFNILQTGTRKADCNPQELRQSSSVYIHTIMEESESQSGENAKGTVRPTSSTTRSATEIYLVGQPASSIRGSKLPTMRQVLKFFFHTVNESDDRQETFKETVRNVLTFWNLARIKTISERGCREKLTRLWEHWRSLQKSRDRSAKDKVENFKSQLDLLWDIGAPDAVEDIEKNRLLTPADKQQDIAFYQDQRGERKAFMSGNDKIFAAKKRKQEERVEKQRSKQGRFAACEPSSSDSRPQTSVVADTPTEVEMEKKDTAIQPGRYTSKHPYVTVQLPRRILQKPALKELADRLRISNNEIVSVVAAVLRSANPPGDLSEFRISRETARRARASHRRQVAAAQREAFTPPPHAVVHWDGKLVKNVVGEEEHRQAIFISGRGHEEGKLLAVLPVKDGTGLTQARATARAIEDWSCASNVKALCFDTTSSNTGRVQGAVVHLEALLEKQLLRLGCRHHVMELVTKLARFRRHTTNKRRRKLNMRPPMRENNTATGDMVLPPNRNSCVDFLSRFLMVLITPMLKDATNKRLKSV